jgi:hypothetical protein
VPALVFRFVKSISVLWGTSLSASQPRLRSTFGGSGAFDEVLVGTRRIPYGPLVTGSIAVPAGGAVHVGSVTRDT